MSLSPQQFTALEGAVNRLASESVLATAGRDDGLVPSYSLAAELCELCATEPALHQPLKMLLGEKITWDPVKMQVPGMPAAEEIIRDPPATHHPAACSTTARTPVGAGERGALRFCRGDDDSLARGGHCRCESYRCAFP